MNRILAAVFALLMSTVVWADVTGNLIYSTANPAPPGTVMQWSGFMQTESTGGGLQGGHIPGYNTSTGNFMFGYAQSTIGYALAINSALSGTGIGIGGVQYGFRYFNQDFNRGFLSTSVNLMNSTGQTLHSYNHQLSQTTEGWTNFDQAQTFGNWYGLADLSTVSMTWTGRDDRGWAGYYGPMFTDQYLRFTYTTDLCSVNPLSSPDCAGYQQAYFTQQCAANPLYDSACPGYATAYHNQQCSINPLYAASCPGYQQAYYNQQCSISALYDPGCPGYQQAYYDQQCSINPLYDSGCANYDIVSAATQPPAVVAEPITVAQATESTTEPAATSTTSPTSVSPAAVVSVINPAPAPAAPAATTQSAKSDTAKAEAKAAEQKKTDQAVIRSIPRGASGAAAARAAAEKADEAAADSASATTIEAQQAAQSLVLGLMGFNPAFSAYQNAMVPDINAAVMARQYNQPTVDNRSALRQLSGASDRLHRDMVDQQYGRIPQ